MGGKPQEQIKLLNQALAIFQRVLGPNHHHCGISLMNLGGAYEAVGDSANQRKVLEEALPVLLEHYPPKHKHIMGSMRKLGRLYSSPADVGKLQDLFDMALNMIEAESQAYR